MARKDGTARSTRIREQVGEGAWAALRTGLILTCRAVVSPRDDWSVIELRLGEIAVTHHRDEADLVSALLYEGYGRIWVTAA